MPNKWKRLGNSSIMMIQIPTRSSYDAMKLLCISHGSEVHRTLKDAMKSAWKPYYCNHSGASGDRGLYDSFVIHIRYFQGFSSITVTLRLFSISPDHGKNDGGFFHMYILRERKFQYTQLLETSTSSRLFRFDVHSASCFSHTHLIHGGEALSNRLHLRRT